MEWTANFNRLPGREAPRALAMSSALWFDSHGWNVHVFTQWRDWHRFTEAYLRPGRNGRTTGLRRLLPSPWTGDNAGRDNSEPELSMYLPDNHWMGKPAVLYRHTVRQEDLLPATRLMKPAADDKAIPI